MPKPTAQQWINRGLTIGKPYEETRKKLQEEGLFNSAVDQELKSAYGISEMTTSERIATEKYEAELAEAQKVKEQKFKNTEDILGIVNQMDSMILAGEGFKGAIGAKTISPFKREFFKTTTPEGEEVRKFRGGTKEADFENLRQSLVSKINLDAREKLKGQGEITESENKMLAKAETLLANPDITEEEFKKQLYAFRDELNSVVKGASEEVGQESQQVGFTNIDEVKQDLIKKYEFAKENPDHPKAEAFLDAFENNKIDFRTGKLKEEFREKSEAEKLVEEKLKENNVYEMYEPTGGLQTGEVAPEEQEQLVGLQPENVKNYKKTLSKSGTEFLNIMEEAKAEVEGSSETMIVRNIESLSREINESPTGQEGFRALEEGKDKWDNYVSENPEEARKIAELVGLTENVSPDKVGFLKSFGQLRGTEKELRGITEQQEALGVGTEERTQRAKDLSLVNNYERALENKDTDEMAQAFLDRLTDEDKAKIEELQKMTPEEREAERQELLTGQRETQEKLGEFGEQIDTVTKKGEEAIKSNRGLETLVDVAEVGEKDIEIVADRVGNIVDAFKKEQAIGSKGVQAIGEIFAGAGEIGFESAKGLAKAGLSEESEQAIAGVASDSLERMLETKAGQAIMEKAIEGGEAWDAYAKENPEDAANIKALLNIAEGAIGFKGSKVADTLGKKGFKVAGGKIKGVAGDVAKGAKEGFEKQAVKQGVKATEKEVAKSARKVGELEDLVQPKMTASQLKKASEQGRVVRGKESKLTGKKADRVLPTEKEKANLELVKKKFKDLGMDINKTDDQEISRVLKDEGDKMFKKLKPEMEKIELDAKTINERIKAWDKIKKTQVESPDFEQFGGKAMHKKFEDILKAIKTKKKGKDGKFRKKNINDLWELRQKYDDFIATAKNADEFSHPRQQWQKEQWLENRRILNDIINDTAKKMGVDSEKAFKEMSALKEVRRNIASKTKLEKETGGIAGAVKKKAAGVAIGAGATALGVQGLQ